MLCSPPKLGSACSRAPTQAASHCSSWSRMPRPPRLDGEAAEGGLEGGAGQGLHGAGVGQPLLPLGDGEAAHLLQHAHQHPVHPGGGGPGLAGVHQGQPVSELLLDGEPEDGPEFS